MRWVKMIEVKDKDFYSCRVKKKEDEGEKGEIM